MPGGRLDVPLDAAHQPREWPNSSTWRGRDATLARLEQATAELEATPAAVSATRSIADEVLVAFELHHPRNPDSRRDFERVLRRLPELIQ